MVLGGNLEGRGGRCSLEVLSDSPRIPFEEFVGETGNVEALCDASRECDVEFDGVAGNDEVNPSFAKFPRGDSSGSHKQLHLEHFFSLPQTTPQSGQYLGNLTSAALIMLIMFNSAQIFSLEHWV
ncbi:hypothetical protein QTN25_010382 [Entamoeba marina]